MQETIIDIIKGMLAPGIMISACGLLLLGMNNKYSLVINRIRTLNYEFRELNNNNKGRRDCILTQMPLLIKRMKLIKNAVWLYTIAIALFIFAIFCIGICLLEHNFIIYQIQAVILFITALIAVLIGVFFAAQEVLLGYKILKIETRNIIYIES